MTEDEMVDGIRWHHWIKKLQELVMVREAWHAAVHLVAKRHN